MLKELLFGKRMVFYLGALMLAGLLLPWWHTGHILGRDALEDASSMAARELRLVQGMASFGNGFESVEHLQERLSEIQKKTGLRSAYLADDGRTVADSAGILSSGKPPEERLPNISGSSPMIPLEINGGEIFVRFEKSYPREQIVAAAKVSGNRSIPDGALYVVIPPSRSREESSARWAAR